MTVRCYCNFRVIREEPKAVIVMTKVRPNFDTNTLFRAPNGEEKDPFAQKRSPAMQTSLRCLGGQPSCAINGSCFSLGSRVRELSRASGLPQGVAPWRNGNEIAACPTSRTWTTNSNEPSKGRLSWSYVPARYINFEKIIISMLVCSHAAASASRHHKLHQCPTWPPTAHRTSSGHNKCWDLHGDVPSPIPDTTSAKASNVLPARPRQSKASSSHLRRLLSFVQSGGAGPRVCSLL